MLNTLLWIIIACLGAMAAMRLPVAGALRRRWQRRQRMRLFPHERGRPLKRERSYRSPKR